MGAAPSEVGAAPSAIGSAAAAAGGSTCTGRRIRAPRSQARSGTAPQETEKKERESRGGTPSPAVCARLGQPAETFSDSAAGAATAARPPVTFSLTTAITITIAATSSDSSTVVRPLLSPSVSVSM